MSSLPTTPPPMYVFFILFFTIHYIYLNCIYSESTPPTTPQHNRETGWQECDARIMGSPENWCIPQHQPHPLPV